jgi:hypothetical protein
MRGQLCKKPGRMFNSWQQINIKITKKYLWLNTSPNLKSRKRKTSVLKSSPTDNKLHCLFLIFN